MINLIFSLEECIGKTIMIEIDESKYGDSDTHKMFMLINDENDYNSLKENINDLIEKGTLSDYYIYNKENNIIHEFLETLIKR